MMNMMKMEEDDSNNNDDDNIVVDDDIVDYAAADDDDDNDLRGPTTMLFSSCDTCSDNIAKLCGACYYGVSHNSRAICCNIGSHKCACVKLRDKGVPHNVGGSAHLWEKVSRDTW